MECGGLDSPRTPRPRHARRKKEEGSGLFDYGILRGVDFPNQPQDDHVRPCDNCGGNDSIPSVCRRGRIRFWTTNLMSKFVVQQQESDARRIAAAGNNLNHWQRSRTGPAWKRLFDLRDFGATEFECPSLRVVGDMLGCRCFGNCEHRRISQQEAQRHLTRGGSVEIRYLLQYSAARRTGSREPGMAPERTVGDHGNSMARTPGNHSMLNCPLFKVVQHLVARGWVRAGKAVHLFKIVHIEIAHAP